MRINPINNYPYNNPSFGYYSREIKDKDKIKNSNFTLFFRDDLDWNKFIEHIDKKYKNIDRVNIYNYASSIGSEAYTMAMLLLENNGEKADKYFPVIAKDRDPYVIDIVQSGLISIHLDEEKNINNNTDKKFEKYFTVDRNVRFSYDKDKATELNAKVNNILKNRVRFECADITRDYKSIKKDNSIVMCRNFWPYLEDNDTRRRLVKNLYNQLGNNSLLIIGKFDNKYFPINEELLDAGFKQVEGLEYVYQKDEIRDRLNNSYFCYRDST